MFAFLAGILYLCGQIYQKCSGPEQIQPTYTVPRPVRNNNRGRQFGTGEEANAAMAEDIRRFQERSQTTPSQFPPTQYGQPQFGVSSADLPPPPPAYKPPSYGSYYL